MNIPVTGFYVDRRFHFSGMNVQECIRWGHLVFATLAFKGTCQTVFQNGHTISHSHQQYMKFLVSWHPHQHLVWSLLFFSILIGS